MNIKVNDKMYKRFLEVMIENEEFAFGDNEMIRDQLELVLNTQGYWSGCAVRIYYDKDKEDFRVESRF